MSSQWTEFEVESSVGVFVDFKIEIIFLEIVFKYWWNLILRFVRIQLEFEIWTLSVLFCFEIWEYLCNSIYLDFKLMWKDKKKCLFKNCLNGEIKFIVRFSSRQKRLRNIKKCNEPLASNWSMRVQFGLKCFSQWKGFIILNKQFYHFE